MRLWFIFVVVLVFCLSYAESKNGAKKSSKKSTRKTSNDKLITDEILAEKYLEKTNKIYEKEMAKLNEVQWTAAINITDANTEAELKATALFNEYQKEQSIETMKYDWTNFKQYNQRQFNKFALIGTSALEGDDDTEFSKITSEMETIYSSAKVCVRDKCNLELEPDLTELLETSQDYDELTEAWVKWRDASGKKMRQKYIRYIELGNKAAILNKIPNYSFKTFDELWLHSWETPDLKEQTEKLWEEIRPFYEKLHAYVRMKLKEVYPEKMPKDNTIPAHILGNMWAQEWTSTMATIPGVDPFPDISPIDVTNELKKQKYTAKKMFQLSDKFFGDLGLDRMTDIFWKKSILSKPKDNRAMVCHASAWDTFKKNDFRIKQCTEINMKDLVTIHHEMGHIQYYMQYQTQPTIYREGANPGFHEAIGDLLALSVQTPKHLNKIKLIPSLPKDLTQINLKFQLRMALEKIAFMPFGYLVDKWRWDVFSGKVPKKDMNRHWWRLRIKYQGVSPPVKRTEKDFDPGAKYHIPSGDEYISCFVSHILQFQIHKALCDIAQPGIAIHECDIDGNEEAGEKLKEMLKLGSSVKWPQQLQMLTGTSDMSAQPLIDYFKPLIKFLDEQISNQKVGWTATVNNYFR